MEDVGSTGTATRYHCGVFGFKNPIFQGCERENTPENEGDFCRRREGENRQPSIKIRLSVVKEGYRGGTIKGDRGEHRIFSLGGRRYSKA